LPAHPPWLSHPAGTNFCLRCYPLADCGWFPSFTITEDYALGMLMKAKGYKAGYLNEYLAIGEAPEEIRNIFRQRSRWCKGQMQVLFSRYCPLLDTGLTLGMRLLYTSVTWCYVTNTLAVPCSVLVPFIALVFGVYPLVLNRDFALAATLFYTSSTLVTMVSGLRGSCSAACASCLQQCAPCAMLQLWVPFMLCCCLQLYCAATSCLLCCATQ
jgi:cellulose synthase/poly-beta-1,6-N-acetylglucosamine synthase-like glycosyltransferase